MYRSCIGLVIFLFSFVAQAADDSEQTIKAIRALDWHVGPGTENVAAKAILKTDKGFMFLNDVNGEKFLKLTKNIPEPGYFILVSQENNWWATFTFIPTGYVKDDEKIDPDELLKQIKSRDESANRERENLGLPFIYTDGWYVLPHYDSETKRLEWGLKLRTVQGPVLNYTIRILGRTGVTAATLVSSPETLDADVKTFKTALTGFEYNSGERYSEFRQGDRMAEYGLGALIVGGAAAVATKKGFWAMIAGFLAAAWKMLVAAVLGALAWVVNLFKKRKP